MIDQLQGHKDIRPQLKELYGDCCHTPNLVAEPVPEELLALINKMLRRIYKALSLPNTIDAAVTTYYAKHFFKAIEDGYGKNMLDADFNTPDYEMLRNLESNVYHFAAAKNYQQLKDLTRALISEEGKLRSFNEFKRAAFEVINEHVTSYMAAEYNLAVASGQMASTWTRIQQNKEVFPLLKYVTVGDDRVRPAHKELEGVIRPVDDSFWNMYYPPNGFNCRCDVIQLQDGKVTPDEKIITPDKMPAMFKTNLAKNGLAFPADHPYYTGMPQQVKEQADKLLHKK